MKVILCENKDWILSESAFSMYKSCMYQPTYEMYLDSINKLISSAFNRIYTCETDGKVVGVLVIQLAGRNAEIIGIAVSEQFQNQGIGKYMIQRIMEKECLHSLIAQTDDDAVGFYRKCGFIIEDEIKKYPDGIVVRYNCRLVNWKNKNLTR